MPAVTQPCTTIGCADAAAYRTRTKPAYCLTHIAAIYDKGGLVQVEPFAGVTAWTLTECVHCRVQAHYRFAYVLDNAGRQLRVCRACHWKEWAVLQRDALAPYRTPTVTDPAEAAAVAHTNGYDYLGQLTNPSLDGDPHHIRCRRCGRLSAERLADMTFGCPCARTTKPTGGPSTPKTGSRRTKPLFKDSDADAVTWWDHDRNPADLWATVTEKARREPWWVCPTGGHRFEAPVYRMAERATCPVCEEAHRQEYAELLSKMRRTMVADVPELLAAWADDVNPATVPVGGGWQPYRFRCPEGHHPRIGPFKFLESGCPSCRGNRTRQAAAGTVRLSPEMVSQWHPTRNTRELGSLPEGSAVPVWWLDPVCGHEWQASPADRDRGNRWRCPECETILDSLAWSYPEVAAEWAPSNPVSAWQVRPNAQIGFTPAWVCTVDPAHVWEAPLASRSAGAGCPECRVSGKSAVELQYLAAAERLFGTATSGRTVRDARFTRRASWTVDIGVEVGGCPVAIEYDGAYWHADKAEVDTAKTNDLLAAGFMVVRLREHPLPPLPITGRGYIEAVVHATAPDPDGILEMVAAWLSVMAPSS